MGDLIAYIILFSVGIGILSAYQYRRRKPKQVTLSSQFFTDNELRLFLNKQFGKTSFITLRVLAKKDVAIKAVYLELIDNKRSINKLYFNQHNEKLTYPPMITARKYADLNIPYEDFILQLKTHDHPFRTFRFVLEGTGQKKYKTHELSFNKNWVIFKPDSGKYN